jgi:glycosyltransferase involved in cell wall biosynthesis
MSSPSTGSLQQPRARVVYFHRFSIEYEDVQFPGLRAMLDALRSKYEVVYFSMRTTIPCDPELRAKVRVKQIPLTVETTNARSKWIQTLWYYLILPVTLWRLRSEWPAFIICKETMPFVPSYVGLLKVPMSIDASDWWWSILFGRWKWGTAFANVMERIEVGHWSKSGAIVIAHSKAEAEVVERKGMPPAQIRIINAPLYRGVYFPTDAREERNRFGFTGDDFVVAVHGIIHPSKGYDQIFGWWRDLVTSHPNWRLLVIGGAGGEAWCRKEIERLGIQQHILMTGWLPAQSDVNRCLNAADCLLVTRRNTEENRGVIPSALYHALATAKPTVVTGLPGMTEIVEHGKNGYAFTPDDYSSFKKVLEYIANHPHDAKRVGEAAPARAEECFNPERAAAKFLQVVEEALRSDRK